MKKIFVVSDLHFASKVQSISVPEEADVIAIAGDIVHEEIVFKHFAQFGKPVIAVAGNHDYWGRDISDGVTALRAIAASYPNVHVLENETFIVGDLRFIGSTFWTSYGELHPRLVVEAATYLLDFARIKADSWLADKQNLEFLQEKITQIDIEALRIPAIEHFLPTVEKILARKRFHPIIGYAQHQKAIDFISTELATAFEGKTIVITHHPPTWEGIRIQYLGNKEVDPNFWNDFRFSPMADESNIFPLRADLAAGYGSPLETAFARNFFQRFDGKALPGEGHLRGVDLWIHGHVHQNMEYALSGTRFAVNALDTYDFKTADSIIDLNDGLNNTLDFAARRAVLELENIINEFHKWASCTEIESISSEKMRHTVIKALDKLYSRATEALLMFKRNFCRATGDSFHGLNTENLFDLPISQPPFYYSYLLTDKHQEMLSAAFIKQQITALEREKINISEGHRYKKCMHH